METANLTFGITSIAEAIACKLPDDEINLLAAILVQLSDTLLTILAQREICSKRLTDNSNANNNKSAIKNKH